jgi:hypothetical protein
MCPRCRETFATADTLRAHVLLPADQICDPVLSIPPSDPEDGITSEIDSLMTERKLGNRIATWDQLWSLIFPQDDAVPSPGEYVTSFACVT